MRIDSCLHDLRRFWSVHVVREGSLGSRYLGSVAWRLEITAPVRGDPDTRCNIKSLSQALWWRGRRNGERVKAKYWTVEQGRSGVPFLRVLFYTRSFCYFLIRTIELPENLEQTRCNSVHKTAAVACLHPWCDSFILQRDILGRVVSLIRNFFEKVRACRCVTVTVI